MLRLLCAEHSALRPVQPCLHLRGPSRGGVPHAIRHGVVFGALDSLAPGSGLILVAPHDPRPLLAQIDQRAPGRFTVRYLTSGPDAWHLQLVRGESEPSDVLPADNAS